VASHGTPVFEQLKDIGREYVIKAKGTIRERESSLVNDKIDTGKIEMEVEEIEVLNTSKPLPFPIDNDGRSIDENMRLKYRYIDLRRERLQKIVKQKHDLILAVRNWMDKHEFLEVITPLLTSTSPEGQEIITYRPVYT
jgi:aspartyl-tRNA synthetase